VYRRGGPGLLTFIYLMVGVFAAADHNYIHHGTVGQVVSAVLAILLWPLILLFDLNLHIH
jgi:hypothetical protein